MKVWRDTPPRPTLVDPIPHREYLGSRIGRASKQGSLYRRIFPECHTSFHRDNDTYPWKTSIFQKIKGSFSFQVFVWHT